MRVALSLAALSCVAACGASSSTTIGPAPSPTAPIAGPGEAAATAPAIEPTATADTAAPPAVAPAPDPADAAPAWVFRYHTPERTETWTLRYADHRALLVVESAQGTLRYRGSADDGDRLALDVRAGGARLTLSCTRARRPLSAACNDAAAPKLDVLDCYHPDYAEPMPFGRAPGVEYVADATCTGYRRVSP